MWKVRSRVKGATTNGSRITILTKLPVYIMTDLLLIQIDMFVLNVAKEKKEKNIISDSASRIRKRLAGCPFAST